MNAEPSPTQTPPAFPSRAVSPTPRPPSGSAAARRDQARRETAANAEQKESEDLFRSMLQVMVEGVLLHDADGRIVSANASAERILGRKAEELLGGTGAEWHAVREDLSPFTPETMPAEVARNTGQPQRHIVMGFHQPQGPLVWVEVHAQPLPRATNAAGGRVVLTLHDITEKKALQEQLFRAQRLESLGLLAAGIAHDLNNVLAPVLMGVPMLRARATEVADLKLLATLEKSAQRGSDLVRRILSFSRGGNEGHPIIQLRHILKELNSFLEATLPKSLRIKSEVSPALWQVKGNPTQLHQVLLNLAVNARDAMGDDGTLRITAQNCELDIPAAVAVGKVPPGPYVAIDVSDTGPGIAPDVLARIWDPFFTTKGGEHGTGLGLSTVRGIVQNHHGHIDLTTEAGKGTTFRVLLPAIVDAPPPMAGGSAAPFAPSPGEGELVLVVDDEKEIRELATTVLTSQGYRVVSAPDGILAYLQLLQRRDEIQLMVTDLVMRDLDGKALAMMARRQFPDLKIAVMTGRDLNDEAKAELQRDSDAILQKPFKPGALLKLVEQLLRAPKAK
jgi:two-component system, cell cycle sensor histidine kinase and response regulator CckA